MSVAALVGIGESVVSRTLSERVIRRWRQKRSDTTTEREWYARLEHLASLLDPPHHIGVTEDNEREIRDAELQKNLRERSRGAITDIDTHIREAPPSVTIPDEIDAEVTSLQGRKRRLNSDDEKRHDPGTVPYMMTLQRMTEDALPIRRWASKNSDA